MGRLAVLWSIGVYNSLTDHANLLKSPRSFSRYFSSFFFVAQGGELGRICHHILRIWDEK